MTSYHDNWESISHSQLKIAQRSLAEFGGLEAGVIPKRLSTPALEFGSLFHTIVLEPDIDIEVHDGPVNPKTFKPYGPTSDKHLKWRESVGKPIVSTADYMMAIRMREAIQASPDANRLLFADGGEVFTEHEIYWDDIIKRKAKLDRLRVGNGIAIIPELKSTEDPRPGPFGRAAGKYGYHTQAASNVDAVCAEYNLTPDNVSFFIIAVGKSIPHDVYCYEVTANQIELGRQINEHWLRKIAECRESGIWLHDDQKRVTELDVPAWNLTIN